MFSITRPSSFVLLATPSPALTQNLNRPPALWAQTHSDVWWNIILPLLRPSILASSLLVFLFDFTSFGVILLLGGSRFSTLEVEIYLRVLKLPDLPLAALLSVIQLICTLIFSILYSSIASRSTTIRPPRAPLNQTSANRDFAGKNLCRYLHLSAFCLSFSFRSRLCRSVPSSALKPIVDNAANSIWLHNRLLHRTLRQSTRLGVLCPANSSNAQFTGICQGDSCAFSSSRFPCRARSCKTNPP